MKKRVIQKSELLTLCKSIYLWEEDMYTAIYEILDRIDATDQNQIKIIYEKIAGVYKAQQEVFKELVTLDPEFPQKLQSEVFGLYSDYTQRITMQEQEEAESLLNFDDV